MHYGALEHGRRGRRRASFLDRIDRKRVAVLERHGLILRGREHDRLERHEHEHEHERLERHRRLPSGLRRHEPVHQ